jgi:hypothetical protein
MRAIALAFTALVTAAASTTACAPTTSSSPAVQTAQASAAPFGRYRTFRFLAAEGAPAGFDLSPRAIEVAHRMQPLLAAALVQKGYVEDKDHADMEVRFGTGTTQYQDGNPDVRADVQNDCALDVNVYDAALKTEVWHAVAVRPFDPGRLEDGDLRRTVADALAALPSRVAPPPESTAAPVAAAR